MKNNKIQRIRDPLHDLIEFNCNDSFERTLWRVIQTPSFQRLRRIKQLGFSEYVYPGATHTRFSHSLGVYHIAQKLLQVFKKTGNYHQQRAYHALAAALVHDVGHGSFSHAFEDVGVRLKLKITKHEEVSDRIIREGDIGRILDEECGTGFCGNVAELIGKEGTSQLYRAVVSSQFDADRLDYIQRDRLMTGTQLGSIDFTWLIANLEVGDVSWGVDDEPGGVRQTFVLGSKSIHAAEAYVLGLFQLYLTVYFHKATRGAEKIFTELLVRLFTLLQDDSGNYKKANLPENHPLVTFAKAPDSLDNYLRLDDTVIMGALAMMTDAEDSLIEDFSKRLRERIFYKCIDMTNTIGHKENIKNSIHEWLTNQDKSKSTRILIDEYKREFYDDDIKRKGLLNQIMIRDIDGKPIDIKEQSDVIKAIPPFEFFRIYIAEGDKDARAFIEKAIEGAENGKKNEE